MQPLLILLALLILGLLGGGTYVITRPQVSIIMAEIRKAEGEAEVGNDIITFDEVEAQDVPEPATGVVSLLGLASLPFLGRKTSK